MFKVLIDVVKETVKKKKKSEREKKKCMFEILRITDIFKG